MPFLIHHISKDSKAWPFTPLGRLYPSLLEGVQNSKLLCRKMSRGSSPWLVGCMWPHMTMNATQHKIINLLKTLWDFFVITCHNVFNMWPKTTLLLPVWPRDAQKLDTPDRARPHLIRVATRAPWGAEDRHWSSDCAEVHSHWDATW